MAYGLRVVAPWRTSLLDAAECHSVACRAYRGLRCSDAWVYDSLMIASVVEVREPHLFCGHVHVLLVEYACVRDEGVESVLMCAAEVINRIAAVACSACRHLSYVRLGLHLACGSEVILHVEARIIA